MDRAGAPNDCLDVKIVRTVLMKTWQIRFDTNFANIVLPTRWTLQSLADSASRLKAMVADSRIHETSRTGSTQQKHFKLLNYRLNQE